MSDGPESKSPGRFSCSSFCKNTFRRPSGGVPPFPAVPFHPGSAVHPKPRPADSPGISCCSKTHRTCCPAPQRQPWASWAGVPVSRVREPAPPKRRRPSSRPYPWGRWSLPGDRTATPRSRTPSSPAVPERASAVPSQTSPPTSGAVPAPPPMRDGSVPAGCAAPPTAVPW